MPGIQIKKKNESLVIRSVEALPARISAAMATGLSRGLLYAAGVSQTQYLTGPRPTRLGVRTNRLRSSIATRVAVEGEKVRGAMGTNVVYGAFWEFGFHGLEGVRAHQRTVRGSAVMVKAHTRKIDQVGRPFIRPAIADALPQIISEINKEVSAIEK